MKIVAIETSGPVGSVCLCEGEQVVAESHFESFRQHAKQVVPCLDALFEKAGWDPRDELELVAVSAGPGSYTGLRVGAACAKTLAYCSSCALVGVSSLDVLARNMSSLISAPDGPSRGCVVLDAKRRQVYCAVYAFKGEGLVRRAGPALLTPEQVTARLEGPAYLLGNGLRAYREQFSGEGLVPVEEALWTGKASTVARLGLQRYLSGGRDNPAKFTPIYMRLPEAVEKRLRAEGRP